MERFISVVEDLKSTHRTVKINTNGNAFGYSRRASFGCLIHNEHDKYITGFSEYIDITTNMHAELVAVLLELINYS